MPSTPLKTASYLITLVEYDMKNSCVLLLVTLIVSYCIKSIIGLPN